MQHQLIKIHFKPLKNQTNRGWQSFSIKDQIVNILGFVGKIISAATTQLYLCGTRATIDST